jgi:membrane protein implicated in regulation of membrane protease activity
MDVFLASLQFWHWLILAAVLAAIEAVAPGMFFIWFGLAAGLVGLIVFAIPGLGWQSEAALFVSLAVVCVFLGRSFIRRNPKASADPALNRRGERYVGRKFTVESPIVNGRGAIKVDDGVWRAAGPDMPAGRQVKVVGVDGSILKVEAAD